MAVPNTGKAYQARQDASGFPAQIGVAGSNGTAAAGTEDIVPFRADPVTGAQYVYNVGPAGSVTLGNTPGGTLNFIGSIATIGTLPSITTSVAPNLPVIAGTPADPGTFLAIRLTDGTTFYNASGGGGGGTTVTVDHGTITLSNPTGTVNTVDHGTITLSNPTGTVNVVDHGTITLSNPTGTNVTATVGTVPGIGTLTNVGSMTNLGSVTNIGNLGNLAGGTFNAGTVTVTNPTGTVNTVDHGTITLSNPTGTNVTATVGTVPGIGSLTNLGSVTNIGSIANIGVLNNGTVDTELSAATALADNIANPTAGGAGAYLMAYDTTQWGRVRQAIGDQAGPTGMLNIVPMNYNGATYDRVRDNIGTSFVTVGTTGTGVWGTIIAASGAGTKQYVSGLSIVVTSGTVDVAVTNIGIGGSAGAGVLARGQFAPGGGIARDFRIAQVSGTNGTIAYWLGGAGTVAISINYWNAT